MSLYPGDDPRAVAAAADLLAAGGLVALPTETVYGLGARADDDAAVAAIFAAKGRPADHPLIVHVTDAAAAQAFAARWPEAARRLADAFWPGPLTLIVPRRPGVAAGSAGGQDSIGLRCPSHPVAQALLAAAATRGVAGVAAPSANRFGRVSPTCAAHVRDEFGPGLLVLDGGDCAVGIESTIVDTTRGHPVLLRPGQLTRAALEAVLGEPLLAPDAAAPRASGTLASHYAPRARVRLLPPEALATALAEHATEPATESTRLGATHGMSASAKPTSAANSGTRQGNRADAGLAVYSRQPVQALPGLARWRRMPADPAAVAHELFAVLRALDDLGVQQIWVEEPPAEPAWEGVLDRLRRASA